MRKFFFLFSLIIFISSCGKKMEEVVLETWPDGKAKRVQYFIGEGSDRYLAKERFYHQDGKLKIEGSYNRERKRDGKWTYWYQDGKKWVDGQYKNGEWDKKYTNWHENGQKHYEGMYDKGKRIGVWKFYDESGKMVKEIDYDKEQQ
jgi:antitoxin component YwqK of YwqJK toxin-antitoxin module